MKAGARITTLVALMAASATSAFADVNTNVAPPRLAKRVIARDKQMEGGSQALQFTLSDDDVSFTLFIPEPIISTQCLVTVHFHTEPWFVIQEHVRRRARHPLVCFQLGQGSTVYRRAFEDRQRLNRCIQIVEKQLRQHWPGVTVGPLELSSFSAGYGAIREILKSPAYVERINTIVLADSMYGSFETNSGSDRVPAREHVEAWAPFATAAVARKKTFVITYSDVPTSSYASSRQCAEALLQSLGLQQTDVAPGSLDAANDPEFPLLRRVDAGRLHVWGYGGTNAQAHLTHVRHLAEIWEVVEQSSKFQIPSSN